MRVRTNLLEALEDNGDGAGSCSSAGGSFVSCAWILRRQAKNTSETEHRHLQRLFRGTVADGINFSSSGVMRAQAQRSGSSGRWDRGRADDVGWQAKRASIASGKRK